MRLSRLLFATLSLSMLATSPANAARETVVLQPSSQWAVDFGEAKCRLARAYGEGENRHGLFMQQWEPSGAFSFTIAGPSFKRFKSRRPTHVRFREGQEERETTPFVGNSEGFGQAVIYSSFAIDPADVEPEDEESLAATTATGLPQLDIEDASAVEYIELRQGKRVVRLEIDTLREAFEVMNTCTQDLVKDWGLDVEKHLTASRRVSMSNYEAIARRVASNPRRTGNLEGTHQGGRRWHADRVHHQRCDAHEEAGYTCVQTADARDIYACFRRGGQAICILLYDFDHLLDPLAM